VYIRRFNHVKGKMLTWIVVVIAMVALMIVALGFENLKNVIGFSIVTALISIAVSRAAYEYSLSACFGNRIYRHIDKYNPPIPYYNQFLVMVLVVVVAFFMTFSLAVLANSRIGLIQILSSIWPAAVVYLAVAWITAAISWNTNDDLPVAYVFGDDGHEMRILFKSILLGSIILVTGLIIQ